MKLTELLKTIPKEFTLKQKLAAVAILLSPLFIGSLLVMVGWNTFIIHIFPSMPEVGFLETLNFVCAWKYLFSN